MSDRLELAHQLGRFIDTSPTPYHAVENAVAELLAAGFEPFDVTSTSWPGRRYRRSGGALIAWVDGADPHGPSRYIGAHTDSPNLRIRPRPDVTSAGVAQLGIEVYGGALLNSWLDRDLGLAGRVALRSDDDVEYRLFRTSEPLLRVPQLAIHLDREVNDRGLLLDRQRHMTPIWSLDLSDRPLFAPWLAEQVDAAPVDVLAWDVACFDLQAHSILGRNGEFLAVGRLDNLASCWAGLQALKALDGGSGDTAVLMLFDHEEVGSATATGADSMFATRVLEQRAFALGLTRSEWLSSFERSLMLSADMAHATHPNYPERHEPSHHIAMGGGPVIKYNVNARYATEAKSAGEFKRVCANTGIPVQEYSHRGDMPCGSTIGPFLAAGFAVATVDVGAPQLSMHSARELMAVDDVDFLLQAFGAWFGGTGALISIG